LNVRYNIQVCSAKSSPRHVCSSISYSPFNAQFSFAHYQLI
jgi:hypothetical protein